MNLPTDERYTTTPDQAIAGAFTTRSGLRNGFIALAVLVVWGAFIVLALALL